VAYNKQKDGTVVAVILW